MRIERATGTPVGLTGATAATRYVGGTASGAPSTGTFAVGDFVIDQTGSLWICTVAGSPGTWSAERGPGYEIGYAQKTTDTSVAATTAAGATVVATTASATYDGTPVMIQLSCLRAQIGTNYLRGVIYMDAAVLQDLVFYNLASVVAGGFLRYTPAAGAHTFGFAAYVDAGTGNVNATSGSPAFIRVTKA